MPAPATPAATSLAATSKTLYTNLLQGMHAAAQPLTILRASLGKGRTKGMSIEEHRELAESSAVEIDRLCNLFNYLQQLVAIESTKPHLGSAQIPPLLEYTAEGVSLLFKDSRMTLKSSVPKVLVPVLIDSARTHQALSSVLLIAHAVSKTRDTIELIAEPSSDGVRITVRSSELLSGAMNAEQNLGLALAQANILSQQGSFTSTVRPFCVQIELPGLPLVH